MNGRRSRTKRREALLDQAVVAGTATEHQELLFNRQQARRAALTAFATEAEQSRHRLNAARAEAEAEYERGLAKLAAKQPRAAA